VNADFGPEAFSYYEPGEKAWKVDNGTYEIQAGLSSRDILARSTVDVK
jgi:hypothetical protein